MISLTRREFDAVSTALIEACKEADRRDRLTTAGLRPLRPAQEPARRPARAAPPVH